jgi:transposase InsO family protein
MDFIEGLPKSASKDVILVVVDRLTKYAHFLALSHLYTAQSVAQLFWDNIFKLHGPPTAISTDRDRIFTSKLWQYIFKAMKVTLQYSTAYHPQTDGQIKRLNQCLENYLRCMTFMEPKKWLA